MKCLRFRRIIVHCKLRFIIMLGRRRKQFFKPVNIEKKIKSTRLDRKQTDTPAYCCCKLSKCKNYRFYLTVIKTQLQLLRYSTFYQSALPCPIKQINETFFSNYHYRGAGLWIFWQAGVKSKWLTAGSDNWTGIQATQQIWGHRKDFILRVLETKAQPVNWLQSGLVVGLPLWEQQVCIVTSLTWRLFWGARRETCQFVTGVIWKKIVHKWSQLVVRFLCVFVFSWWFEEKGARTSSVQRCVSWKDIYTNNWEHLQDCKTLLHLRFLNARDGM